MTHTTLSDKFQLTLPPDVRETLKLSPGDEVHFVVRDGHVEVVTGREVVDFIRSGRGIAKGIDPTVDADDEESR